MQKQSVIGLIEEAAQKPFPVAAVYTIQPGDTLGSIIRDHYQVNANNAQYAIAEGSIMHFNQQVKDPDVIKAGDHLRLMPLPSQAVLQTGPVQAEYKQIVNATHKIPLLPKGSRVEALPNHVSAQVRDKIPINRKEQVAYNAFALLEENYGILSVSAGAGLGVFGNIVGRGNDEVIREISGIYEDFKNDKITRNQYDYKRKKVLQDLARRVGPFENILLRGKASQRLRINRKKSIPATQDIHKYADKLTKLSRYATRGNVLLAGAGAAMSCKAITDTSNRQEKNEILVETTFSTLAGAATGVAVTIFLVSNPFGWAVAVGLGVGAAAASYGIGKATSVIYANNFNEIDLVNLSGVDQLCR